MILNEMVRCAKCGHTKAYPDTDADAAWRHDADAGEYVEAPRTGTPKRLEWDEPAPVDLFDGGLA